MDFHFVGVLVRVGFRGSEDCSETPPGVSVTAATELVSMRPDKIIIVANNSILKLRMVVAPFVWVCSPSGWTALANAQVAKPDCGLRTNTKCPLDAKAVVLSPTSQCMY